MNGKYYYLRREDHRSQGIHRCGIVYLVKDDKGGVGRGVSLCNNGKDPFMRDPGFLKDPKVGWVPFIGGLKSAKKRALRAIRSGVNSGPIMTADAQLKVIDYGIVWKSEFNPQLSNFEERVLKGKRD